MPENVLDEIRQWTKDNFTPANKIQQIYLQKGGWEGWAQVELALHFTAIGGWNCQREILVYHGSQKRADLLLTAEDGPPNTTIIELKTEALWRDDDGADKFVKSMKEDLYKIDHNNIDPKYLPVRLVVFGCTFVPTVSEYATNPANWGQYAPYITGMKLLGSPNDFLGSIRGPWILKSLLMAKLSSLPPGYTMEGWRSKGKRSVANCPELTHASLGFRRVRSSCRK